MIQDTFKKDGCGIESWDNKNRFRVLWMRWSCDPEHGETWADELASEHGGRNSPWWRREMEGDFRALEGGLVFPEWSIDKHVIPPLSTKEIETWPKWRFIDPGLHHPTAVGFFTTHDGVLYLYDEICVSGMTVDAIAPIIKAKSARQRFEYTAIDPSAFARTLTNSGRSIADLFVAAGIAVNPAQRAPIKRDQIAVAADLLHVQENGQPRFKATNNCVQFIKEVAGYRWRQGTEANPTPEEPVKIDDDMVDTFLYASGMLNPMYYLNRGIDPLKRWYDGSDPRKQFADSLRIMGVMRGSMMEPD